MNRPQMGSVFFVCKNPVTVNFLALKNPISIEAAVELVQISRATCVLSNARRA
jgi:hypothetical protein